MTAPDHLSPSELAAFADGRLQATERSRLGTHLDSCDQCREELAEVLKLVDRVAKAPSVALWRRYWKPVTVAVAAGLAAVVVAGLPRLNEEPSLVRAPGTPADAAPRITAITPADGTTQGRDSLEFVWHAYGADSYRFTLLLDDGTPRWTKETTDTSVELPPQLTLEPGRTYFWRVDALNDGVSATTGMQRLELRR